ncbi:hypothetical protein [Mucilaginibacter psychrotolerans]|nr:hypothetical protein [Mucilaginibacter psychrotolerans]
MNKTGLLPQSDDTDLITCNNCYYWEKRKLVEANNLSSNYIREALGKI